MPQQCGDSPLYDSYRDYDVTIEEVRALASFRDYSDEQIIQLMDTIKAFTRITLSVRSKRNVAEGRIITLTTGDDKQKAA
ncbi:hypothetical protein [Chitinophaga sp. 212800010-3]|uniref:hypothetical protein n=1 Tax=unclassified Chitinophaga TaxID=2619133 RepID=UPI002DF7137E|nr:EF-hand domain-containing protein [Chitinophaga sp. 212800010-3]